MKSSKCIITKRFKLIRNWVYCPCIFAEGGNIYMSQINVRDNESLDSALKRFKRQTTRDGIIQEVRKREHYEKPSVKRKKKSEAARKHKYR